MLDILGLVLNLRRPALLSKAAKLGVQHYKRDRDLKRILQTENLPRSGEALMLLLSTESELNSARTSRAADYRVTDHVETLIAIAGETALYRESLTPKLIT